MDNQVTFKDMKNLHHYLDLLLRASHMLEVNTEILSALGAEAEQRRSLDMAGTKKAYDDFQNLTKAKLRELKSLKDRCILVHTRGEGLASLVRPSSKNVPETMLQLNKLS